MHAMGEKQLDQRILLKSSIGGQNCINKRVIFWLEKHDSKLTSNYNSPNEAIQGTKLMDTHVLQYNSSLSNIRTVPTENNMFEMMQEVQGCESSSFSANFPI